MQIRLRRYSLSERVSHLVSLEASWAGTKLVGFAPIANDIELATGAFINDKLAYINIYLCECRSDPERGSRSEAYGKSLRGVAVR